MLFGSVASTGMMPSWFSLFDLRLVGASFVINGKLPGVFARVVRRCVLGLLARTRGAVGFVLVVIGTGCACSPSVAACSPSVAGSCLPATIVSMAFLISLIALVFYFFFKRCRLSSHSAATVSLCCCSFSVGSWQFCGYKSNDADVR